jgi:hypothetical protein
MLRFSSFYLAAFAPFSIRAARNLSLMMSFASLSLLGIALLMLAIFLEDSSFLIILVKWVSDPAPPYSLSQIDIEI